MYDLICVLGTGTLAKNCLRLLAEKNIRIIFYDVNECASWQLKRFCEKTEGLEYRYFPKKECFEDIKKHEGRILLLSIVNPYIVPKSIVRDERFTAINLHHALLPAHPGRNAEAWTIFEEDEYGGITWHFMGDGVDDGDIITQGRMRMDETLTSWKYLKLQNDLGLECFRNFYEDMLGGSLKGTKQEKKDGTVMHYSRDRLNGGVLDMNWSGSKISAFLRAMDYGPVKVMGDEITVDGRVRKIKAYSIKRPGDTDAELKQADDAGMLIKKDGYEISLLFEQA